MGGFYESDRAVSEYLFFHYGSPEELLPWGIGPKTALNYPVRCVTELMDTSRGSGNARALDLGCAVGRSTFELARHCDEVIGIDFSQRFVEEGRRLQADGQAPCSYVVEGDLLREEIAKLDAGIDRSRVSFEQGDATDLRTDLGSFDVVLMANLLCRLPNPRACLERMITSVNSGGQLLITTPCTWLEEYTPKDQWLGGFERDGREVRTLDSLKEILGEAFELDLRTDMPFLIREHSRKFQWSVAEGTRWIRR